MIWRGRPFAPADPGVLPSAAYGPCQVSRGRRLYQVAMTQPTQKRSDDQGRFPSGETALERFGYTAFRYLWIATVVSLGAWMYNAAAGWLMTSLNANPLIVSLVQVASSLPLFLFRLPAGALRTW